MDLVAMSNKERFEWMRKRHVFLNNMVSSYDSIEKFVKGKEHWFALLGMDLGLQNGSYSQLASAKLSICRKNTLLGE